MFFRRALLGLAWLGLADCSHDFEFLLVEAGGAGAGGRAPAGASDAGTNASGLGGTNAHAGTAAHGGSGASGRASVGGGRPAETGGAPGGTGSVSSGGAAGAAENGGEAGAEQGGASGEGGEGGLPAQAAGGTAGTATSGGAPQGGTATSGGGTAGEVPDPCLTTPSICPPELECVKRGACSGTWVTATSELTLNGDAAPDSKQGFVLSDDSGRSQTSSIFTTERYALHDFRFFFDYSVEPTTDMDVGSTIPLGFTVTVESAGATALGQDFQGLGYAGITPSVAVAFDAVMQKLALAENGQIPEDGLAFDRSLYVNTLLSVELDYDGTTLTVDLSNGDLNLDYHYSWVLDLPALLGANDGYFGITAASGYGAAYQRVGGVNLIVTP